MRYKVKDIGEEGLAISLPITETWLADACPNLGVRPIGPGLKLLGRLEHTGADNYLLRGDLRGQLGTACARCLEPASVDIDVPMIVSYVEKDEVPDEEDVENDDEIVVFTGGQIDVGNDVRDEIVLAMPIGPLCQPDCAGLCSVCGGNRNASPCTCEEDQRKANSKFGGLAKLKL
jgi:uncharacterized metal-binding protein YceD (DUF177 family)